MTADALLAAEAASVPADAIVPAGVAGLAEFAAAAGLMDGLRSAEAS